MVKKLCVCAVIVVAILLIGINHSNAAKKYYYDYHDYGYSDHDDSGDFYDDYDPFHDYDDYYDFYEPVGPFYAGDLFRKRTKDIDFDAIVTSVNQKKKNGEIMIEVISDHTKNLKIADYYEIGGYKFKVTALDKYTFLRCYAKTITIGKNVKYIYGSLYYSRSKNCDKLIIKSKKLKSKNIANNAFTYLPSSIKTVVVPKSKYKEYKKLLKRKGLSKNCKIVPDK